MPEQEQLLTVNEAARRMGVSPKIVRTLVDHHQLPSVPVGSRVRIPAAAVQVYVELFDDAADLARQITAAMKPPAQEDPS